MTLDVRLKLRDPRTPQGRATERTLAFTAPLELFPANHAGVQLDTSAAVRDAVKATLRVGSNALFGGDDPRKLRIGADGAVHITVSAQAPPIDLSYQVLLRSEHGDWPLGTVQFRAKQRDVRVLYPRVPLRRGVEIDSATIVLRPDPSAARETLDVFTICGSELEFPVIVEPRLR